MGNECTTLCSDPRTQGQRRDFDQYEDQYDDDKQSTSKKNIQFNTPPKPKKRKTEKPVVKMTEEDMARLGEFLKKAKLTLELSITEAKGNDIPQRPRAQMQLLKEPKKYQAETVLEQHGATFTSASGPRGKTLWTPDRKTLFTISKKLLKRSKGIRYEVFERSEDGSETFAGLVTLGLDFMLFAQGLMEAKSTSASTGKQALVQTAGALCVYNYSAWFSLHGRPSPTKSKIDGQIKVSVDIFVDAKEVPLFILERSKKVEDKKKKNAKTQRSRSSEPSMRASKSNSSSGKVLREKKKEGSKSDSESLRVPKAKKKKSARSDNTRSD